MAGTLNFFPW
jgi:hypothetical protein